MFWIELALFLSSPSSPRWQWCRRPVNDTNHIIPC